MYICFHFRQFSRSALSAANRSNVRSVYKTKDLSVRIGSRAVEGCVSGSSAACTTSSHPAKSAFEPASQSGRQRLFDGILGHHIHPRPAVGHAEENEASSKRQVGTQLRSARQVGCFAINAMGTISCGRRFIGRSVMNFLKPPYPSPISCLDDHEMCWEGERHQSGGALHPHMAKNLGSQTPCLLLKICKKYGQCRGPRQNSVLRVFFLCPL